MPDPLFGLAAGALSLCDTLVKIHQEHARDPKGAPGLADIIRTIPSAAFEASGRMIAQVNKLELDCRKAKIDLKQTYDQLAIDKGFYLGKRYRVLDKFQVNVHAISAEIAMFFDDIVAIANCSGSEALIAAGYKQALERKNILRRDIADEQPIGVILENLRRHAEQLRTEIGDIDKK